MEKINEGVHTLCHILLTQVLEGLSNPRENTKLKNLHRDQEQAGVRPPAFRKTQREKTVYLTASPNSQVAWLHVSHSAVPPPSSRPPSRRHWAPPGCTTQRRQQTNKRSYLYAGLYPTPLTSRGFHNLSHETSLAAIPIFSYAWQILNCWYQNLKKYMKNTIFLLKNCSPGSPRDNNYYSAQLVLSLYRSIKWIIFNSQEHWECRYFLVWK